MDPKALFLEHLELIDRISASVCRRNGVFNDDARDFAADVRLKLIEHDYAVLRKFRGQSSTGTYLTVVIGNLFRDAIIKDRGKWRPSAKARRLGGAAVLLESLLYRDGHSLEEACKIIETNTPQGPGTRQLLELAKQLPPRTRRRVEGAVDAELVPSLQSANGRAVARERDELLERARTALGRLLATFAPEDRVMIRMRFEEGFTVAQIARVLGLEQRSLYGRVESLLGRLRAGLEQQGIGADLLEEL